MTTTVYHQAPSEKSLVALAALKAAVTEALEKKKKLGQYAVVWEKGEVVLQRFDLSEHSRNVATE